MRTVTCAICNTNKFTHILYNETLDFDKIDTEIFSARRIPDRIHYKLLECRKCGLIFSSPILPESKLKNLYTGSKVTYDHEIDSLKNTYGYYVQKTMRYAKKNPSLLEIGAGNGFFLEKAKDIGIKDVAGIEPGKHSVKAARPDIKKNLIVDFFPSKKIKRESKDIICIFQTLDHMTDPNLCLSSSYTALKKDGLVLCIVHDTEGLSVQLLKEKSPIFDVEHIFLFNKKNLQQIFEKNGFTTLEIMNIKNTFPLRYWVRMFPLPRFIKTMIISLLKIVGADMVAIALSAGNIGIIARKDTQ